MYICKNCGNEINLNACKIFTSKCFISQQSLVRYQCPICDVIFGPLNMITATTDQIKDAYLFAEKVFKDADSTDWECATFHSLNPSKDKLYLNFGCGKNSRTVQDLRLAGWNIIGYEPYVTTNKYFTLDKKEDLLKYKFDGIISNDLIEHLQNPIEDFLFMKSLLKDKSSLMAHSTGCYRYTIEWTKYHLHFFVGKAINLLCKKTGFYVQKIDDQGSWLNYIYGVA